MCKRECKHGLPRDCPVKPTAAAGGRCGCGKPGNKNYLSPKEQKMGALRAITTVWLALALWCAAHDEGWR